MLIYPSFLKILDVPQQQGMNHPHVPQQQMSSRTVAALGNQYQQLAAAAAANSQQFQQLQPQPQQQDYSQLNVNVSASPSILAAAAGAPNPLAPANFDMPPPPSRGLAGVVNGAAAAGSGLANDKSNNGSEEHIFQVEDSDGDKKQMKRAANRRSAQLSRKRKKQFIEELRSENQELRKKELILRSIPDLIVVFDSAGKIHFLSHSVTLLLKFPPGELEGTSFWDRMSEDSVRLLKSAFMDAMAARRPGTDTAPLVGVTSLKMIDRNGNIILGNMNGVVHFSGDAPECVCSIRPVEMQMSSEKNRVSTSQISTATVVSESGSESGSNKKISDTVSENSCERS